MRLRYPTVTVTLAIVALAVFGPQAPATAADPLDTVVATYEALAQQTDGADGPGWPDVSKAAAEQRTQRYVALRSRLAALPTRASDPENALTRRLLDWRLQILIEGARYDEDRIPFDNGDGFFNTANYAAATTVLRSEAQARAWIARIAALPGYYDQQVDNLRRGIATGFTAPRPTAESVLAILRIATEQPASASPLLAPLRSMPPTVPAAHQAALRAEALDAVDKLVKPMQRRMLAFFETEYLPRARAALAASSLPDGRDYYAFALRRSTTLSLTPDEVYAIGEREIAGLRVEMEAAMRDVGYAGTLSEFVAALRVDPRFYAPDLPTYIEKASEIGKRIDAMLPRWFGKLPRLTWGIRIKPPELEASSSGYDPGDPAKGVAGSVVVGSQSFHDPLFSLPAWVLHEGVPGHHLQIALSQERDDLPRFRRRDDVTAFVEGWALYSERLGEEMGVYRTPYEHFGRLAYAMWRACRLQMDVGIHWKGWSAEQAEQCLRDNTTLPERIVHYETQRYIAWPAQALAYKIGELKITELRRNAEQVLGAGFDVRAFHDALLDEGPMPLSILEEQMTAWARTAVQHAR